MKNRRMTPKCGSALLGPVGEASVGQVEFAHQYGGASVIRDRHAGSCLFVSIAVAAAVTLSLAGLPALAFADDASGSDKGQSVSKTQVVYTKASSAGDEEGTYVVNMFEGEGDGSQKVEDAGSYESVKNLTDGQELSASGVSKFEVSSKAPFLYQGDLPGNTELPWKVSVSYSLDGKEVAPEQLAGSSGSLKMKLKVEPNDKCKGAYADNYLLQITGLFDNNQTSSLKAKDSTTAQSGDSTQVGYMVFPGKSETYTVKAEVHDFEFDGWTIVGVPLSMAMDLDDEDLAGNASDLDSLESAIKQINKGASSLSSGASSLSGGASDANDGARSLASGASELSSGASALASSASDLDDGASDLSDGTKSLASGAATLVEKLDSLDDATNELKKGSSSYAKGLSSQSDELEKKAKAIDVDAAQKAYEKAAERYVAAFSGAFAQAYAQTGSKEQAQSLAEKATKDEKSKMESSLAAFVKAQAAKTGNESAAEALDGAASGYSQVDDGISSLSGATGKVSDAGGSLASAAKKVQEGAGALSDGTSQLADGAQTVSSGAGEVSSGSSELASGVGALSDGAAELADGAESLSEGTSEAENSTKGLSKKMIDKVRDQIEERLNPDYDPVDFVDKNNEVESVQFVIKTGEIEVPDDDNATEVKEEELSFWQKLLALFGL